MVEYVVYITKDVLYAVKHGTKSEYWRANWNTHNLAKTLVDVVNTLGTTSFHVILGLGLPSLTGHTSIADPSNKDNTQSLISEYQSFLISNGVNVISLSTSSELVLSYILSQGVAHADVYLSKYEHSYIEIRNEQVTTAIEALEPPYLSSGLWLYVDNNLLGPNSRALPDLTELIIGKSSLPEHQNLAVGSLEDLSENQKISLVVPVVIILGILFAVGFWLLWGQTLLKPNPKDSTTVTISPTPLPTLSTPSPSPTPTPSPVAPSPNNKEFVIQVQNGSGVNGLGGKISARLEKDGFVVKDVTNADSFNYTQGVIKAKASVPTSTISTIESVFLPVEWKRQTLPENNKYDIVIIIGSQTKLSD